MIYLLLLFFCCYKNFIIETLVINPSRLTTGKSIRPFSYESVKYNEQAACLKLIFLAVLYFKIRHLQQGKSFIEICCRKERYFS